MKGMLIKSLKPGCVLGTPVGQIEEVSPTISPLNPLRTLLLV